VVIIIRLFLALFATVRKDIVNVPQVLAVGLCIAVVVGIVESAEVIEYAAFPEFSVEPTNINLGSLILQSEFAPLVEETANTRPLVLDSIKGVDVKLQSPPEP